MIENCSLSVARRAAFGCGFNWSMQHLNSSYRYEDVENEVSTEDLLLRCTEGIDVGSEAERPILLKNSILWKLGHFG